MIVELYAVGVATMVGLYTGLCFIWRERRGTSTIGKHQISLAWSKQMPIRMGRRTRHSGSLNRPA